MKFLFTYGLFISTLWVFSQGSIVLVGGGSESDASNSWSNAPYQWAVDQSANKRVAIISYDSEGFTSFLEDYFANYLGAVEAKNIGIPDRDSAQTQSIYDLLMTYDVFFFKGGDQSDYYELYKDTKVTQAINDKYQEGGVIAGTSAGLAIISEVIFSAEGRLVYPDLTLSNLDDEDITLRNDFVSVLPDVLADSHFIERGRFARLMVFLGKWYLENDERILGIGVDDKTAVCIHSEIATVYGTGAASFYEMDTFSKNGSRPVAEGIRATQVLHGYQYSLPSRSMIADYPSQTAPIQSEEQGNYQLFLSGDDTFVNNRDMLTAFSAAVAGSVIIISSRREQDLRSWLDYLKQRGVSEYQLVRPGVDSDPCSQVDLRNTIRNSNSFLFLENNANELFPFLSDTETGLTISSQLKRNKNVLALVGQDARFVGARYCTNNLEERFAAYDGDLEFAEGLKLLETTIVMPRTFSTESVDFYENNTAAIAWEMTNQRLGYGIYLNENSYAHFYQQEGTNYLTADGFHSTVLVKNTSTFGDIADQPTGGSGNTRQIVGFDEMEYSLLSGQAIAIGNAVSFIDMDLSHELLPVTEFNVSRQFDAALLEWASPTDDMREGFRLFKKSPGAGFALLTEVPATATSYKDTQVQETETYAYYIVAYSDQAISCRSQEEVLSVVTSIRDARSFLNLPNPMRAGQRVEYKGSHVLLKAKLMDLSGRKVASLVHLRQQDWLVPSVEEGVYLLQLHFQHGVEATKIVIR